MFMAENKKKSSKRTNIILVLILLAGIGILCYPSFSDWYNSLHQSYAITDYNQTVENNTDEENAAMLKEAEDYNAQLAQTGNTFHLNDEETKTYESILNVSGSGIMGYINIDKVKIHLPIYHGTTEGVLQIAVGHLAGTSLPVGGENTHAVLTGHTGLPSSRLFTDIDRLKKGDTFQIVVLDKTLTYQVRDIRTVLPDQLDSLQIEPGKDLVTLVTCTPYGINTHRLLVTGERIPNPKNTAKKPSKDWKKERMELIAKIAIPIAIAAAVIITIIVVRKKKKARQK